jgi:hypothetical protein
MFKWGSSQAGAPTAKLEMKGWNIMACSAVPEPQQLRPYKSKTFSFYSLSFFSVKLLSWLPANYNLLNQELRKWKCFS